ncbi:MAG: hypothetical protein C0597_17250 [Marinilabiliales bacterium]|nr:MAG: hypothetical protein C0597_17250 [Marinilabiliales bacterium]
MMKRLIFISVFLIMAATLSAQYIFPLHEYNAELKDIRLTNFDIHDTVLYLPLGEQGLRILNIKDLDNIYELSEYIEYEKRSKKSKIYGFSHQVKVIDNLAYISYGPLGLKILDVSDPTMPFVIGHYYRYEDVSCAEIYENFALLGYVDMGLEIVDLSNLNDIKMISRNNVRGFTVKNIQIIPPFVIISGGERGLRIFKFGETFTAFKQVEFPKEHLTDSDANKILVRGTTGYLANDIKGLSVLNMGLPLYPLQVNNIKTKGKATELIIDRNYLYVASGKYIEIFDIKEPEKPAKIFEHEDKDKEFVSLKIHHNQLFALYASGNKEYGFVIFQVE